MKLLNFIPKLIILDRDGVINQDYPTGCLDIESFKLLPGVIDAIRLINDHKILTAVATNQALVGRGEISMETLDGIHTHMQSLFKENGVRVGPIYVCTDTEIAPHYRRKPAPGMLLEAMDHFNCLPVETVFIGDAMRDIEAARNANCTPILVRTGKGVKTENELTNDYQDICVHDNLYQAVKGLLHLK